MLYYMCIGKPIPILVINKHLYDFIVSEFRRVLQRKHGESGADYLNTTTQEYTNITTRCFYYAIHTTVFLATAVSEANSFTTSYAHFAFLKYSVYVF